MGARGSLRESHVRTRSPRSNARAEPGESIAELDLYAGILRAAHRFALSALCLETAETSALPAAAAAADYATFVDRTLGAIDETLRGAALPADLPDLRAAHRDLAHAVTDDSARFFAFEADNVASCLDTTVDLLWRDAHVALRRARALDIKRSRRSARPS